MKKLRLRKKMLTAVVLLYAGILAVSVTYAAVTGMINFTGTATTTADLSAIINNVQRSATTPFGSNILTNVAADGLSMDVTVDLRAPGDRVYIVFDFLNDGSLPVEFEAPEVEIISRIPEIDENTGLQVMVPNPDPNPPAGQEYVGVYIYPVIIEGFVDALEGILDFEDVDGHTIFLAGDTSERFGMAFIWCEDTHVETDGPLTFTIEFPFVIGDINPPAPPVVTP